MDNGFNLKEDRITFDCMPEDEQMTDAGFNALMGCTILWGLICNFFICMFLEVQVFNFVAADRKSTRLNSSHKSRSRMPSSA